MAREYGWNMKQSPLIHKEEKSTPQPHSIDSIVSETREKTPGVIYFAHHLE